jgi:two-component system LytT family response regulator
MVNIMIVEDDEKIAKGLESIIVSIRDDVEIMITGFAKEALEESSKLIYDLFLLDIQLLDYSGLELATELRKMDKYKLTPIIFITANPTKELLAFKRIHCYDYIVKPFSENEVREALSTILNYGIKKEVYMNFNLKNFVYRVKMSDIIYFEAIHRRIKVVTINEEFELSHYTLKRLEEELKSNFIRCHKGFIVNSNYIASIDKTNSYISLKNTTDIIPIGRKYKDYVESVIYEHN